MMLEMILLLVLVAVVSCCGAADGDTARGCIGKEHSDREVRDPTEAAAQVPAVISLMPKFEMKIQFRNKADVQSFHTTLNAVYALCEPQYTNMSSFLAMS